MKYISNSRAKTYRRCPKQYDFKYIMGLEPRMKKVQLERGTWLHELLEVHYSGGDWKAVHLERVTAFNNLLEEIRDDLGADLPSECGRIMRSYLRYWKQEDAGLVVVDTEMDEIVTLPNGLPFRVIIDLIVKDQRTGLLWPWDHKSRKNFARGDDMLMDPQLTNYYTALEIMGYTPLGGVCYNELRTKAPAIPEVLKKGGLSKRMNIDTDVYTYMREIRKHDLDPNDYAEILRHIAKNQTERFFRRRKLPKDPPMLRTMRRDLVHTAKDIRRAEKSGQWPRNFMTQCNFDCDFKSLCIAQLHGADLKSMIRANYRNRTETDEVEERKR